MKISVIVPYYNRENTIQRCLKSIGASDDVEIIVVDDFSLVPYSSKGYGEKILRCEFNQGPVSARIQGSNIASHEWVIFLDSDDELLPDWRGIAEKYLGSTEYQIHGFTSVQEKPKEVFYIDSRESYWNWVDNKQRSSDYILCLRKDLIFNSKVVRRRVGEVWFINKLFETGKGFYHKEPLFIYNQDCNNQLSKNRSFKLSIKNYDRKSIEYVVSEYCEQYDQLPFSFKRAWLRRLIKESILSLNLWSLVRLINRIAK